MLPTGRCVEPATLQLAKKLGRKKKLFFFLFHDMSCKKFCTKMQYFRKKTLKNFYIHIEAAAFISFLF